MKRLLNFFLFGTIVAGFTLFLSACAVKEPSEEPVGLEEEISEETSETLQPEVVEPPIKETISATEGVGAPAPQRSPQKRSPKTITVQMTDSGFSPAQVTVKAGDMVRFTNSGSIAHWPASGVHPTHQLCPGFDALRPIDPGTSYTYTFSTAKECPMHDHLNPSLKGKIVVQ